MKISYARRAILVSCLLFSYLLLVSCSLHQPAQLLDSHGKTSLNLPESTPTDKDPALSQQEQQLANVSYKLRKSARITCDDQQRALGIFLARDANNSNPVGDYITVAHVTDNSVADLSGIKTGDILRSLRGQPLTKNQLSTLKDKLSNKGFVSVKEITDLNDRPVEMSFYRPEASDDQYSLKLRPESTCKIPVQVVESKTITSRAEQTTVEITSGMLDYTQSETELAYVLSHNMAHYLKDHPYQKDRNWLAGSSLDWVASSQGVPTLGLFGYLGDQIRDNQYEKKADYTGLYLMERAGYETSEVPDFWRRLANRQSGELEDNELIETDYYTQYISRPSYFESHPAQTQHLAFLEETLNEINSGKPLSLAKTQDESSNIAPPERQYNYDQSKQEKKPDRKRKTSKQSTKTNENKKTSPFKNARSYSSSQNSESLANRTESDGNPDQESDDFTIQLASFVKKAEAHRLAHRLDMAKINSHIAKAHIDGKQYYRVRIGSFEKRVDARERKESIREKFGWKDYWITRRSEKRRLSYLQN